MSMRVILFPTVCVDITEPGRAIISGEPGADTRKAPFQGLARSSSAPRRVFGCVSHVGTAGDPRADLEPVARELERDGSTYAVLAGRLAADAGWTGDLQVIVCQEWRGGIETIHDVKINKKGR